MKSEKLVFFALFSDEASDISLKEQLCICIHWVDDNITIHEAANKCP